MAQAATFTGEERIGLGVAIAAHVGLAVLLTTQMKAPSPLVPPERVVVSLATDVSLESTAPDPSAEPAASLAPQIDDLPAPEQIVAPEPVTAPREPVREPVAQPARPAPPRPSAQPTTRPTPRPTTRPTARATPTAAPTQRAATGSRLGDDFLKGTSDANGDRGSPAATFGTAEQAALSSAITRQLKPHWSSPSGVDADQLVTVLSWELNADGSLKGMPRVVSQSGINDSNRPQAALHAERAIRAVQLAAPFNLPDRFYDRWQRVREWRFDRRL